MFFILFQIIHSLSAKIESYNEVSFKLKFKVKTSGASPIEIRMNYEQKGRKGVSSSLIEIV